MTPFEIVATGVAVFAFVVFVAALSSSRLYRRAAAHSYAPRIALEVDGREIARTTGQTIDLSGAKPRRTGRS